MLGWFKKKFSKKEDSIPPVQDPLESRQSLISSQPPETSPTPEPQQEQPPPGKDPVTQDAVILPAVTEPSSMFKRLSERLSKTRDSLIYRLDTLFLGKKVIDAKLLDDLEELLITADLGIVTTTELLDHARRKVKRKELSDPALLKEVLKEKIRAFITDSTRPAELVMPESGPFVIMVIGVNGVGKTTTIGKIAHKFLSSGRTVLLVAADTFRAAAVAQLQIWGERNKIKVVAHKEGADPSSVVYDALAIAKADNTDVVLVDTAGRLHTQTNLMEELKKIKRVMAKKLPGAPHEVMLVIDATTGQNGISQAKLFNEAVEVTGITLTKLDGTAKGGIVANICRDLKIPIRFIGIGEHLEDLRDFDPDEFIEALFQQRSETPSQQAA
jgi:fused signal recognition particle receptor